MLRTPNAQAPAFPAKAADWIAQVVLTKRYRDSCGGIDLIRMCACQYGICGHCGMGKHGQCPTRSRPDWRPNSSDTHVVGRGGGARTEVRRAKGPDCTWRCPCTECAERAALPRDAFKLIPPARRKPAIEGQGTLF